MISNNINIFKMKRIYFIFSLLSFVVASCQKNETMHDTINNIEINPELHLLQDVAEVIRNANNHNFVFDMATMAVNEADEFESVYLNNLVSYKTKSAESLFDQMLEEINSIPNYYDGILNKVQTRSNTISEMELKDLDVEFYVPYPENFRNSQSNSVTVGYHPLVREDWTDGYKIYRDGKQEYIPRVDDEYAQHNLTIIVMPKDTSTYSQPISHDEIIEYLGITDTKSTINNGLITQNITQSDLIDEDDVLYTAVAGIRANGKDWLKFLQRKMKLSIYRASGDVVFASDGSIVPSGSSHKPISIAISRSDCKDKVWQTNGYIFDDDWDLHETNQKIYFVTEHNVNSDDSATATVGIGWKDGKFTVDAQLTAEVKVDFSGKSKLRVHNELTRKSILANNMDGLASGTHSYQGHNFAIRSYGIIDLVYVFYYTKVE